MKRIISIIGFTFFGLLSLCAQSSKPPLDFSVYDRWNSLSGSQIDDQGEWLMYQINPSVGDGLLYLRNWNGDKTLTFNRGTQPSLSPGSEFLVYRIKVQQDTIRKAKLDKVKSEAMPKDSLGIYIPESGKLIKYPKIKGFQVADSISPWIAFQLEELPKAKNDTTPEPKSKKKKEYKGTVLHLMNPISGDSIGVKDVTEYGYSQDGNVLFAVAIDEDSIVTSKLHIFDAQKGSLDKIWEANGVIKRVAFSEDGTQLACLHSSDTTKEKVFSLYHYKLGGKEPRLLVDSLTDGIPDGWCVSEEGRMYFSKSGKRLFFGIGEKPMVKKEEKDTLLDDDKVFLDIWHWEDVVLQTMQLKQVNRDRSRSYPVMIDLKSKKLVRLGDPDFVESFYVIKDGDGDLALGLYEKPYELSNAINFSSVRDVYLLDLKTGEQRMVFEQVLFRPALSPEGKYLYWWEPADSSWYSYLLKSGETINMTIASKASFARDTDDTPEKPGNYGMMGWTAHDKEVLLYEKHDIWMFDPAGEVAPVCITHGLGREGSLQFRYVRLDRDETVISPEKPLMLSAFHTRNKQSGFYLIPEKGDLPVALIMDDCRYGSPVKARMADKLFWTRSTVTEYPDMWISDARFNHPEKITNANPQQNDYNWLTVELVEWLDFNGEMHQGLLYKPEDFDPSKKYPMMVYFYERHSDGLHSHIVPRASSSTINTAFYASNGYLVFHPDIHYKVGFPGKSSYDAIVSGVMALGHRPYVDMKHLGLQGQSWGGYETAYLITQTDLFAAASPGAPVANMTSAYGGIRTESGMCRQVQYEKGQSRIGGTLWEKPELYIENSPLFYADRINTPCLIRHNDNDGAVPFAQGVEFFVALRRLGKPAWLLNYNNDGHNLTTKLSNRKDLSVRMKQFFDHYLKGEPAPDWMTQGVKATEKKSNETYYMKFVK